MDWVWLHMVDGVVWLSVDKFGCAAMVVPANQESESKEVLNECVTVNEDF
jgi:hypothetical protein